MPRRHASSTATDSTEVASDHEMNEVKETCRFLKEETNLKKDSPTRNSKEKANQTKTLVGQTDFNFGEKQTSAAFVKDPQFSHPIVASANNSGKPKQFCARKTRVFLL